MQCAPLDQLWMYAKYNLMGSGFVCLFFFFGVWATNRIWYVVEVELFALSQVSTRIKTYKSSYECNKVVTDIFGENLPVKKIQVKTHNQDLSKVWKWKYFYCMMERRHLKQEIWTQNDILCKKTKCRYNFVAFSFMFL